MRSADPALRRRRPARAGRARQRRRVRAAADAVARAWPPRCRRRSRAQLAAAAAPRAPSRGVLRSAARWSSCAASTRRSRSPSRSRPSTSSCWCATRSAGADGCATPARIFDGPYAPAPLGDYLAGPNHVLPTGGSARFFSPLGIYDFVKRTSVVRGSAAGAAPPGAGRRDAGRARGLSGARGGDPRARLRTALTRTRRRPRAAPIRRAGDCHRHALTARTLRDCAARGALRMPAVQEPRAPPIEARAARASSAHHEGDRHHRRADARRRRQGRDRHRRAVPRPHARQLRAARLLRPDACGRAATSTSTSTTPSRTSAWRSARRCARRSATRPASAASARPPVRSTRRWCAVTVDLSGRPFLVYNVDIKQRPRRQLRHRAGARLPPRPHQPAGHEPARRHGARPQPAPHHRGRRSRPSRARWTTPRRSIRASTACCRPRDRSRVPSERRDWIGCMTDHDRHHRLRHGQPALRAEGLRARRRVRPR